MASGPPGKYSLVAFFYDQLLMKTEPTFLPLADIKKPNIHTAELAFYSGLKEQTWRKKLSKGKLPDGLQPIHIGKRLQWPTSAVKTMLGVV